jgi:hypothetical protein
MDQQLCDCELELFLHKSLMDWLPPELKCTYRGGAFQLGGQSLIKRQEKDVPKGNQTDCPELRFVYGSVRAKHSLYGFNFADAFSECFATTVFIYKKM